MKRILVRTLNVELCFLLGALWSSCCARASDDAIGCVKTITMPGAYSSVMIRIPATVEARIQIGNNGRAERVTYDTEVRLLTIQLDAYFRERARYRQECMGKTISFTVHYMVVDPAVDFPVSEVRFDPPDQIYVICHRLKPALDPVKSK